MLLKSRQCGLQTVVSQGCHNEGYLLALVLNIVKKEQLHAGQGQNRLSQRL